MASAAAAAADIASLRFKLWEKKRNVNGLAAAAAVVEPWSQCQTHKKGEKRQKSTPRNFQASPTLSAC